MIDFTAFAHGQVQSKLWLCEELEKHLPEKSHTLILGSWYGVLNFMLLTRNPKRYELITGIDKDEKAIEVSQQLLNAWNTPWSSETNKSKNLVQDLDEVSTDILGFDSIAGYPNVVINCSCEHMSNEWFNRTAKSQLLCIQTSNRVTDDPSWGISNPNPSMEEFKEKYPMSQILFEGEKVFDYGHLTYSRYMLIGRK